MEHGPEMCYNSLLVAITENDLEKCQTGNLVWNKFILT